MNEQNIGSININNVQSIHIHNNSTSLQHLPFQLPLQSHPQRDLTFKLGLHPHQDRYQEDANQQSLSSRSKELQDRVKEKIKIDFNYHDGISTKPLSVRKKQKVVIPGNHEEVIKRIHSRRQSKQEDDPSFHERR